MAGIARAGSVTWTMSGVLSGAPWGDLNSDITEEFPLGTPFSAVLTYDDSTPAAEIRQDFASYHFAPGTWGFDAVLGDVEVDGDSLEVRMLNLDFEPMFGSVVAIVDLNSLAQSGVGAHLRRVNLRMLDLVLGAPFPSLRLADVPSGLDELSSPNFEWMWELDYGDGPEEWYVYGYSESFSLAVAEPEETWMLGLGTLLVALGFRPTAS